MTFFLTQVLETLFQQVLLKHEVTPFFSAQRLTIFTLTYQLTLLLCKVTSNDRHTTTESLHKLAASCHKGRGGKKGVQSIAIRLYNLEAAFILSCDCRNPLEKKQSDPCSFLDRYWERFTVGLALMQSRRTISQMLNSFRLFFSFQKFFNNFKVSQNSRGVFLTLPDLFLSFHFYHQHYSSKIPVHSFSALQHVFSHGTKNLPITSEIKPSVYKKGTKKMLGIPQNQVNPFTGKPLT